MEEASASLGFARLARPEVALLDFARLARLEAARLETASEIKKVTPSFQFSAGGRIANELGCDSTD